jgi:hypothetical protein
MKKAPNMAIVTKVKGLREESAGLSLAMSVMSLPMQKVWQQPQAGYHYKGWKGNAIEEPEYENERKNNARPNGGPLLRFCKLNVLCPRSALPTFS